MSAYGVGGGRGGTGPRFPSGPKRHEGGPPADFPRSGGGERFDRSGIPLGVHRPPSQPWFQPLPPPPPLPSSPPPPRPPAPIAAGSWDRNIRNNYSTSTLGASPRTVQQPQPPQPPQQQQNAGGAAADFWKTMSTVKEIQNPSNPDIGPGKGGESRSSDAGQHKKLVEKPRTSNGKRRDSSDFLSSPASSKQTLAVNGKLINPIVRDKPGATLAKHGTEESTNKHSFSKHSEEKSAKLETSYHAQAYGRASSFSSIQTSAQDAGDGSGPGTSRIRTSSNISADSLLPPPPISPKSISNGTSASPYSPNFPNGPVSPLSHASVTKSAIPPISPVSGPSSVNWKRSSAATAPENDLSRDQKKRRRWGQGLRTPLRTQTAQTASPKSGEERTERATEMKMEKDSQLQGNHVEKEASKEGQARPSADCNGISGNSVTKANTSISETGAQVMKPPGGTITHSTSKAEGMLSTSESMRQNPGSVSPNPEGLLPKPEGAVPKPGGEASKPEDSVPNPEGVISKPEGKQLKTESVQMKNEEVPPKPMAIEIPSSAIEKGGDEPPNDAVEDGKAKPGEVLDVEMGDATVSSTLHSVVNEGNFGRRAKSPLEGESSTGELKESDNAPAVPGSSDPNGDVDKPVEQSMIQTPQHHASTESLKATPMEASMQQGDCVSQDVQTVAKKRGEEEIGTAKQQQRNKLIAQILDLDTEMAKLEEEKYEIEEEAVSKKEVLASYETSISKITRDLTNPSPKEEDSASGVVSEDDLDCGSEDTPAQYISSEQLVQHIMLRNKKKSCQANRESSLISNEDEMLVPSSEIVDKNSSKKGSWNQLYVTTAGALELALKLDRWQGLESHMKTRDLFMAILGARRAAIAKKNEELAEIHRKNWVEHRKRMIQAANASLKAKTDSSRAPSSNHSLASEGGNAGPFSTLSDRELRLLERNGRGKESSFYQMGYVRSEYEEQQILLRLQHDEQLKTLVKQPGTVIDKSSLGMRWAANKNGWRENPEADQELRYRRKPWTPDEVERFVEFFSMFGKDFRKIAKKLSTRSTQECVEFFYIHQKSSSFRILKEKYERKRRGVSAAASAQSLGSIPDKTRSSSDASKKFKAQSGSIAGGRKGILVAKIESDSKQSSEEEEEDDLVNIMQCKKRKRSTARLKPSSESLSRLRVLLEPFWTLEDEKKFVAALESHGKNFRSIAAEFGSYKSAFDCRNFFNQNRKRLDLDALVEKLGISSGSNKELSGKPSASVEQSVKKEGGSGVKGDRSNPDDGGNNSHIMSPSLREKASYHENQPAMSAPVITVKEECQRDQYASILKTARNMIPENSGMNDNNRNFVGMNGGLNEGKPNPSEDSGAPRLPNQFVTHPMKIANHPLAWSGMPLIMPPMPSSRAQPHRPIQDLHNMRSNMASSEAASKNRFFEMELYDVHEIGNVIYEDLCSQCSRQGHSANNFDAASEVILQNASAAAMGMKANNAPFGILPLLYGGNLYNPQGLHHTQVQSGNNGNDARGSVSSTPTTNIYDTLHSASQGNQRVEIPNLQLLNAQLHPYALQQAQLQRQRPVTHVQTHGVSHAPVETTQIDGLHKGARGPIGVDSAINTSERVAHLYGRTPAQQVPYNHHLAQFVPQLISTQSQSNLATANAARLYHSGIQPHLGFQFPNQADNSAYTANVMSLLTAGMPGLTPFSPEVLEQLRQQTSSTAIPKRTEQRKDDQRTE